MEISRLAQEFTKEYFVGRLVAACILHSRQWPTGVEWLGDQLITLEKCVGLARLYYLRNSLHLGITLLQDEVHPSRNARYNSSRLQKKKAGEKNGIR